MLFEWLAINSLILVGPLRSGFLRNKIKDFGEMVLHGNHTVLNVRDNIKILQLRVVRYYLENSCIVPFI